MRFRTSTFVLFAVLSAAASAQAPKGMPHLVSKAWDGSNAAEASRAPAISKNGRFVAFLTDAMEISGTDAPGQVVVLDRETGVIERVSRSLTGDATDSPCERAAITADGRIVAYSTRATNVASAEDPESDFDLDVYRFDRASGITERVSVLDPGNHADADCGDFDLSDDGRFVAFASDSKNLSPLAGNGFAQIYLRDTALGITWLLSRSEAGAADADCASPRVDDDGSRVVFVSTATNLGGGAAPTGDPNVWLADVWKDEIRLVSRAASGDAAGDGASFAPAISPDGRYVAFVSTAANLTPGTPSDGPNAIYLADTKKDKLRRIAVATKGLAAPSFVDLDLSRGAKHLAFLAHDSALGRASIGLYARASKTTKVATIAPGGAPVFSGLHGSPVISSDGRFAAFDSTADALSPEADSASDVYLYRR